MACITYLEWTINNFATASNGSNAALISEEFLINGTTAIAYLAFCPISPTSIESCSLLLQVKNSEETTIKKAIVTLWITNKHGYSIGKTESLTSKHLLSNMKAIGFESIVARSDLFSPSSNFIKDDKIIITCEIICTIDELRMIPSKTEQIYLNEVLEGCILMNGKEQFCVTKQQLISSSIRFETLLNSSQNNGIVHVRKMESEIFEELKHYILFGNLSENWPFKSSKKIYELVKEYELDHITAEHKKLLLKAMTEKELIFCLIAGFRYNDIEMKTYAFQKLRDCFSSNIEIAYFETQDWINFASENLKIALKTKITVYKAIGIIVEEYNL